MPKLWNTTIDQHRRDVRDAIMETTALLVAQRGVRGVTMSEIAEVAGIGRATLYKYFPDVESILLTWHERRVADHLAQLAAVCERTSGDTADRVQTVLEAYAELSQRSRAGFDSDLVRFLHGDDRFESARQQLHQLIHGLIAEGAALGELRDDVRADELAAYCLHAVGAAATLTSRAAARRLARVTVDGLRPQAER